MKNDKLKIKIKPYMLYCFHFCETLKHRTKNINVGYPNNEYLQILNFSSNKQTEKW